MAKRSNQRQQFIVAPYIAYYAILTSVMFVINFLGVPAAIADEPGWATYEKILKTYVKPGISNGVAINLVDYAALKRDPDFSTVLDSLAKFPITDLASVNERIAFYINAYNILAISVVLGEWPVESIRDVGNIFRSVWKREAGIVGGQSISLDKIEHQVLRAFGDPRIHFAIVCASVSCPDLRMAAYRADHLEEQLDAQTRAFLDHPKKGLRIAADHVEVSKIFKWFRDDFDTTGGVELFIRRYRDLAKQTTISPSLDYDWSVNAQ